jgi:hypothetical protein
VGGEGKASCWRKLITQLTLQLLSWAISLCQPLCIPRQPYLSRVICFRQPHSDDAAPEAPRPFALCPPPNGNIRPLFAMVPRLLTEYNQRSCRHSRSSLCPLFLGRAVHKNPDTHLRPPSPRHKPSPTRPPPTSTSTYHTTDMAEQLPIPDFGSLAEIYPSQPAVLREA